MYRNYWNRSRPCIILDSKIPQLVLEALLFEQFFLYQNIQKGSNKLFFAFLKIFWYLKAAGPSIVRLLIQVDLY